jgi:UDP-2,3-diacylglucosamine pyrophosphatase LpxH
MQLRTYYPTVVLSDIHLGTPHSKKEEVSKFLKSIKCDKLILNGDIIDGWHFSKEGLGKLKLK